MKQIILISFFWLVALLLGVFLNGSDELLRGTRDNDLIALLLGGSRTVVSKKMFELADRYYHGGVRIDYCAHGMESGAEGGETAGKGDGTGYTLIEEMRESGNGHEHEHEHEHDAEARHQSKWQDWWTAINAARVPSGHRHLHGERAEKEILPWIWAAVKADPHNIMAYTVGSFWLASRLERVDEAIRLLQAGIESNPYDYELPETLGRLLHHQAHDSVRAYELLLSAKQKWEVAWQRYEFRTGEAPDTFIYSRILRYLGLVCEARNEPEQAAAYYRAALPYVRDPETIERKLQSLTP